MTSVPMIPSPDSISSFEELAAFDVKAYFAEHIEPLFDTAMARCREHNIPSLVGVMVGYDPKVPGEPDCSGASIQIHTAGICLFRDLPLILSMTVLGGGVEALVRKLAPIVDSDPRLQMAFIGAMLETRERQQQEQQQTRQ